MFDKTRNIQLIALLLFIYSISSTIFFISRSSSSKTNSEESINQLNATINNLKIELEYVKKDNEDLKAIRALMEKERAEKEAAQKKHVKSLKNLEKRFQGIDSIDLSLPKIDY
jgi:uncharacterized protein (DUF3084 family)